MFVRRDKSQKTTMLTGWVVRYDGFIFGSNCSWGRKMEVCRCRTWKRNSGSICQNHFILCQTNLQYQNNYFLDKKNWKSASDRHCDVIFGFYMVKFGVKWPSEVKTWYLQPRSTPIFFSLVPIANGPSIQNKSKKIWEVRFLTATVASFKAQKDQIGGEIHCRSYILSSSQKSPS